MTPMHYAVQRKDLALIEKLLENGNSVNQVTNYDSAELCIALELQDEQLMNLILDHGGNIEAKTFGKTPLHWAV